MSTLLDEFIVRWKVVADTAALKGLEGKLKGFAKRTSKISLGAGAAVAGIGGLAFKEAIEVEKALAYIDTLKPPSVGVDVKVADPSGVEKTIGEQAQELIRGYKLEEVEGLQALYSTISSSVAGNPLELFDVAIRTSVGGMVTMEEGVQGLASTLNAYNMTASDAARVSDVMHAAVAAGQTTFQLMGKNLSTVTGLAATMGIGLEDATASIVSLTLKGISTGEAATAVRAAMIALQNPTKQLGEYFAAQGYASGQAAIDALGFQGAMELVEKATQDTGLSMKQLLSTDEAVKAGLALTGENADKARENIVKMGDAAGFTDANFEKMSGTAYHSMRQARASFASTQASLVRDLLPALTKVAQAFANMPTSVVVGTVGVLGFLAVLSPIAGGLAALVALIGKVKLAMVALSSGTLVLRLQLAALAVQSAAMAVVAKVVAAAKGIWTAAQWALNVALTANPIGLVIAGIAALIAVLVVVVKYWDNITAAVKVAWEWLDKLWASIEGIKTPLGSLGSVFKALTNPLYLVRQGVQALIRNWDSIIAALQQVWNAVKKFLPILLLPITPLLAVIAAIRLVIRHWDTIVGAVQRVIDFIAGLNLWELGAGVLRSFIAGILSVKDGLVDAITGAFSFITNLNLAEHGRRILQTLLDGILGMKDALVDGVKSVLSSVMDFLPFSDAKRGPLSRLTDAGRAFVGTLMDGISGMKDRVVGTVSSLLGNVRDFLPFSDAKRGPLADLTDSGAAMVSTFAQGMEREAHRLQPAIEIAAPALPTLDIPTLPTLDIPTLPTLDIPTLPTLDIPTLPTLDIPAPALPTLDIPTLPTLDIPAPALPTLDIPAPALPTLDIPTLPTLDIPAPALPTLDIPTLPTLDIPAPALPTLDIPTLPTLDIPAPALPDAPTTGDEDATLRGALSKLTFRLTQLQTAINELATTSHDLKVAITELAAGGGGQATSTSVAEREPRPNWLQIIAPPGGGLDQAKTAVAEAVAKPVAKFRAAFDDMATRVREGKTSKPAAPKVETFDDLKTHLRAAFDARLRDVKAGDPPRETLGERLAPIKDTLTKIANRPPPGAAAVNEFRTAFTDIAERVRAGERPPPKAPPPGAGIVPRILKAFTDFSRKGAGVGADAETLRGLPAKMEHALGPTLQRVAEPTTFRVPAPVVPPPAAAAGTHSPVNVGGITINIAPTSEAEPADIARAVRREMEQAFKTVAEDNATAVLR